MWIKKLTTPASDPGALSFVLRLTAIIILLRPMGPWWISFLLLGIAVSTLIFPRILHAPDYPDGVDPELAAGLVAAVERKWGTAGSLRYFLDAPDDDATKRAMARYERMSASPDPSAGDELRETGRAVMSGRSDATPYVVFGGTMLVLLSLVTLGLLLAALMLWVF